MSEGRGSAAWRHGRGRGRNLPGRGRNEIRIGGQQGKNSRENDEPTLTQHKGKKSSQQRFREVKESMQEAAEKFLSPEEESDEEEEISDQILDKTLQTYTQQMGADDSIYVSKAKQYLTDCYTASTSVCLICIAVIKHSDPVWSCTGCFCIFHLNCIQNWAKHGAIRPFLLSEEHFPAVDPIWHCPKCRYDYKLSECPTKYVCFCTKEVDPKFDPWLVPHSCGHTCGKILQPNCGHTCLLLCHPGPCPPCPTTVKLSCLCGKQAAQVRRCSAKEWSCGQICGKALLCGQHYCQQSCHKGECAPCQKQSIQACACGKEKEERSCSSPFWQCNQTCKRSYSCGYHVCEKTCHSGECGVCPRSLNRTCPCGKTSSDLPCTEDIPTCGDTCGKLLPCELHYCTQRCHTGPCETCRQMTVKSCRCGARKKSVQCFKDYQCETKCNRIRDCGKHQCKRKCCDWNCPGCEQPCNKSLSCKNHKCPSKCHQGLCYPCPLTVDISCRCGDTVITVPCGREKVTKAPRCKLLCRVPPDCHHGSRQPHPCHFGRCPACTQICNKALPNCHHHCPDPCHSAVLHRQVEGQGARSGPWEPKAQITLKVVELPCQPCRHPLLLWCRGKHQEFSVPCSEARSFPCGRVCGRKLKCTNHTCQLECHEVSSAPDEDQAGIECQECEAPCEKERPEGCNHKCFDACHPGPCKECTQMLRKRCHCNTTLLYVECSKWTSGNQGDREKLLSCQHQCPKLLPCDHACTKPCHPGSCVTSEMCTKKVTVRCSCRRKKKDFPCNVVRSCNGQVKCDDICEIELEKKRKALIEAEKLKQEEILKRQQKEVEEFERRFRGKKKSRKRRVEKEEQTWWQQYRKFFTVAIIAVFLAVFVAYLLHVE
ncbi:NF-X1-type zinc finger protein NFXL1-like [Ptychodera flava]|uniref:NF-X1-type zinc finger protein NFXL1-like n=1 Tax=Ptychodera flava TaxID=63121 RepID=UPI00396A810D